MPTDIAISIAQRRITATRAAADLRAIVLLVPLIMAIMTIGLSMKSPAFAAGVIGLQAE
jgi:hypothetical protein